MRPRPSYSALIAYEIEGVEEEIWDRQGALDGSSVLALHRRIVPPERFLSERPSDRPQRYIQQHTLGSFKRQWKGGK
jgi:hypothetical protein